MFCSNFSLTMVALPFYIKCEIFNVKTLFVFDSSLVPYRTQSTDARAQVVQPGPREPYSPHQHPENNMDFVMARADDLLNWGRRVCCGKT